MMCATPLVAATTPAETRKVVTILFADVTGSTAIGERLDPEAVRRVLTTFYASARETLERRGGTVEKFIGDAVMAVFGVPRIHEDDAIRGVRAAWELLDVMARMNEELSDRYGAALQLRIGVNTGEVVAGDPATGSSFVAGDAVNVAARLEQAAVPGTVYLGAETYELARSVAEVEPAEPLELKGKSERVPAFRLLALRATEEAMPGDGVPFVGRGRELDALGDAFGRASRDREVTRIALVGPAGIGKTRLVEEFVRRSIGRARAVRCRCFPEGEGSVLRPILDLLASALGVGNDAAPEELAREARRLVAASDRSELLAATVSRIVEDDETADAAWALVGVLRAIGARDPLIVWIDDAHLAAPSQRGSFDDAIGRIHDIPAVWVESYRSDDESAVARPERRAIIELDPLSGSEARDLLAAVSPSIPRARVSTIVERAEGNPLFILETARLVAERPDAAEIPSGIRALLAARFDSLSVDERRVLECVAAGGRSVPRSRLEELLDPSVLPVVDALSSKGFLTPTAESIAFTHGSLRDVAYSSTTKEHRAELHERIADLAERDREPIDVVAHHLETAAALRAELGAPDEHDRMLSGRAAIALAAAGELALRRGDRTTAVSIVPRAGALAAVDTAAEAARTAAGRLAFTLGSWDEAIAMLDQVEDAPGAGKPLGVALVKRGVDGDVERGRALLERAAKEGDVDAAASLAGTWKGVDEQRALELYRAALELDPTDPYALGNVLEYEIVAAGDLSPVAERRPALASALMRRRGQALTGEDHPWSFYDLGKFELFLGEDEECVSSFAAAVWTSSAPFMLETTARSLDRVRPACEGMAGYRWGLELLRLGLAARFSHAVGGATPESGTWILVGGSSAEGGGRLHAYRTALVEAFRDAEGTLVSGGTAQGVSALAADVSAAVPRVRSVGYLPSQLPEDVSPDDRYGELRMTEGDRFSPLEPIVYWRDLLDAGIPLGDIRVLGIGGGRLTALELRLALAFGATVGVMAGSGGTSTALLRDQTWGRSSRLSEVEPTPDRLRAFLLPDTD
jgi:class 3 adenylate cyclase/tetratricopeptide (TPR) repeat protein